MKENNKINTKTFLYDFNQELLRRIEIVNLIKTYKKNLINEKTKSSTLRLPKLIQSNSNRNFKSKKKEKINKLKTKQKTFLGESRINYDNFHQKKGEKFRNTVKTKANMKLNITNRNRRDKNSLNVLSFNQKSNTNENIDSNNRVRTYKIKNFENIKIIVDDFNKVNNDYFFLKKNHYIRKNNVNMDIFNLLGNNNINNNLFIHTMMKTPKI